MHRIGYILDNIEILIFENDLNTTPHFHFRSKTLNGCIRIDEPEYLIDKRYLSKLNIDQIKSLIKFLNLPYKGKGPLYWKYLINCWNSNNSQSQVPETQKIPDYLNMLVM